MTTVMTQPTGFKKPRVLFLCTGNTARSQMAQALLKHHAGERFEVVSAGLEPGVLNPLTVRVLQETGLDTEHLYAKDVKQMIAEYFHYVITVCDRAEANCPIFPHATYRMSLPFEDPAAAQGSDEDKLAVFRRVLGEINVELQSWLKGLK